MTRRTRRRLERVEVITNRAAWLGIITLLMVLAYVARTDDGHTTRPADRPSITLTYPALEG